MAGAIQHGPDLVHARFGLAIGLELAEEPLEVVGAELGDLAEPDRVLDVDPPDALVATRCRRGEILPAVQLPSGERRVQGGGWAPDVPGLDLDLFGLFDLGDESGEGTLGRGLFPVKRS